MSGAGRLQIVALLGTILTVGAVARAESVKLRRLAQISEDSLGTALDTPEGVSCNGKSVAVADTGNGRIVLFDVQDDLLVSRTSYTLPELPQPIRIAFLPDGGLLVLDGRARRIGHVGVSGSFEGWLEPEAAGEITPRALAVGPDGKIYVLDIRADRVLVLDGSGALVRQIALPASVRMPSDLTVDDHGEVWVVDGVGAALYRANDGEEAATTLAELPRDRVELAHAIAADSLGRLFVVDRSGGRIAVLGRDGAIVDVLVSMGWGPGELRYPGAICVDPNGFLFVADRENSRVQVFATGD